jgi:Holliday junction DNA helicase RuvA
VIDFIKGSVSCHGTDFVVIDVNGIGYQVFVTNPFQFHIEDRAILFTNFIVREDAQLLYGFPSEEERDLFRLLLEVSGVGPKAGMAILSGGEPSQFVHAVQTEDISLLTRFPGIGKKTAQRIVLDLRDKLKNWGAIEDKKDLTPPVEAHRDVIDALIGLGYNEREAKEAVVKVKQFNSDQTISTEEFIRQALQVSIRV